MDVLRVGRLDWEGRVLKGVLMDVMLVGRLDFQEQHKCTKTDIEGIWGLINTYYSKITSS